MVKVATQYGMWALIWRCAVGAGITYGLCYVLPVMLEITVPFWAVTLYLVTSLVTMATTKN
jgi:hypothetical protein